MTDANTAAKIDFLAWCHQQRDEARELLAEREKGQIQVLHGLPGEGVERPRRIWITSETSSSE